MASSEAVYTRRRIKNAIVNLFDIETGTILIQNRPAMMDIDDGLGGNTEITEVDSQGFEVKIGNNFKERKPKVTLTFKGSNLDITSLQRNRRTQTTTATLRYPWRQQVLKAVYNAVGTGKLGHGIVADADTRGATLLETGETALLTQQSFATFDSATPNSFAIGADYERRFSDDLLSRRAFVVLEPEKDFSVRKMSEVQLGYLELNALCFMSDNTLEIIEIPTLFVNPEGGGLKPGDDSTTVNLDIATISRCEPYNTYEISDQIFCDE